MPDIIAAADETAGTSLVQTAIAAFPIPPQAGSGSLGPFNAAWSATASVSVGTVDFRPPNIIRLANCTLNYSLSLTISFDLSNILPDFCLPQVCVRIPFIGRVCVPPVRICVNWPTITIPVSHSGPVNFTADFALNPNLSGGFWNIDLIIVGTPFLQLGPAATAILAAIGVAAALALSIIPFIGPFLAGAVLAITAAIGIAALTGLLGQIITPFISGMTFTLYKQPQLFEVLPAAPPDAAVLITLDSLAASVRSTDENELVIEVDFTP
jgi:hypothetical protein